MADSKNNSSRSIRWWPSWVIGTLAIIAFAYVWEFRDAPRQEKNIQSAVITIITSILLLVWWIFFSRAKWKHRLSIVLVLALLVGIGTQFFEIIGVSGDLVPIIRFKSSTSQQSAIEKVDSAVDFGSMPRAEQSFLQFLGSNRNAVLPGVNIPREQMQTPPKELWRQPIGQAWSGFVVEGPLAYTQEQAGDQEAITCYQLSNGNLIWQHAHEANYQSVIAGNGPRATPTIAGDHLVTMGSTGVLNCFDKSSGEVLWSHNVIEDTKAKIPEWGFSPSPLVIESEVIVPSGEGGESGLRVYDLKTGSLLRTYPALSASYSSPILAQWGEQSQILYLHHKGVAGLSTTSDQMLWDMAWGTQYPDVAVPVVLPESKVFITSGYGVGCALLELSANESGEWTAKQIWKQRTMKAKFTNVVTRDGFVYGLDDGMMACIDLETGRRQWKEGRYGHGQMFLLDNAIMILSEKGDIVWLEINPKQSEVIAQWHALDGKTWNPPCLAWPYLLLRNDQEAVCYQFSNP